MRNIRSRLRQPLKVKSLTASLRVRTGECNIPGAGRKVKTVHVARHLSSRVASKPEIHGMIILCQHCRHGSKPPAAAPLFGVGSSVQLNVALHSRMAPASQPRTLLRALRWRCCGKRCAWRSSGSVRVFRRGMASSLQRSVLLAAKVCKSACVCGGGKCTGVARFCSAAWYGVRVEQAAPVGCQ
jgi:hypothetical protein